MIYKGIFTMINSKVRSQLDNVAAQIEGLATNVRSALTNRTDIMEYANQLVVNAIKLTFQVGELYALESNNQASVSAQSTTATAPKRNARYHNVRDNKGRFTRDVAGNAIRNLRQSSTGSL